MESRISDIDTQIPHHLTANSFLHRLGTEVIRPSEWIQVIGDDGNSPRECVGVAVWRFSRGHMWYVKFTYANFKSLHDHSVLRS